LDITYDIDRKTEICETEICETEICEKYIDNLDIIIEMLINKNVTINENNIINQIKKWENGSVISLFDKFIQIFKKIIFLSTNQEFLNQVLILVACTNNYNLFNELIEKYKLNINMVFDNKTCLSTTNIDIINKLLENINLTTLTLELGLVTHFKNIVLNNDYKKLIIFKMLLKTNYNYNIKYFTDLSKYLRIIEKCLSKFYYYPYSCNQFIKKLDESDYILLLDYFLKNVNISDIQNIYLYLDEDMFNSNILFFKKLIEYGYDINIKFKYSHDTFLTIHILLLMVIHTLKVHYYLYLKMKEEPEI
jgi:hypothetical protein